MLKQILRDMHIDPEILAGLDDTQKQTLFCKMREEQIRRWRLWDQKHERLESALDHPPSRPPTVQFLHGADGEPWVWVMGEHTADRQIDDILADEAKQRARQLAEIETKELRKSYVAEMSNTANIMDFEVDASKTPQPASMESTTTTTVASSAKKPTDGSDDDDADALLVATPTIVDDLEIYCSVDELRDRIKPVPAKPPNIYTSPTVRETPPAVSAKPLPTATTAARLVNFNLNPSQPAHKPEVLREITHSNRQPASQKVSAKIALWEKRVIGEKTNEIYLLLQQKQADAAAEAEAAAHKRELEWQQQEERAKVAEVQMRDIARKAREEHRKSIGEMNRSSSLSSASSLSSSSLDDGGGGAPTAARQPSATSGGSPPSSLDSTVARPPSLEAVVRWYRDEEFHRGCGIDRVQNRPHRWFHGAMSRADAERLLGGEPAGTFLVRLSDKIWGYAISYRDAERCKHYLVDASVVGAYQFLGANQLSHDSLNELIRFHANVPITLLGRELLLRACSPTQMVPTLLDGLMD